MILPAAQIPTKVLFRGEDVMLTVGELRPNLPRVFAIPLQSGHMTEFFVDAGTGDRVTVAFASCRKCYRAGHYRQGGYILCNQCKELMERAASGQRISPEKDCTQVPIPFEVSGDHLTVRASSVDDAFALWYAPLISEGGDSNAKRVGQN
jgi:uncharacterized membrane protein